MPQYLFPRPMAEEFTGTPDTTAVVSIYKVTSPSSAPVWRAQDEHGTVREELTPTAPLLPTLPEIDRRRLLTAWAHAYDIYPEHPPGHEPPAHGVPAWVFVHLHTSTTGDVAFYMYGAVRPRAGQAFEHILKYASWGRPQDWDWLFRDLEEGEEKRHQRPFTPEIARLTELVLDPNDAGHNPGAEWTTGYRVYEKQTGNERYEWPDGSAITVQGQCAWGFGFHRDEVSDRAVIEACADDVNPLFAWPAEVAVPAS